MKIYQVNETILGKVLNYLAKQPYNEVNEFIQVLANLPPVKELEKRVTEKENGG